MFFPPLHFANSGVLHINFVVISFPLTHLSLPSLCPQVKFNQALADHSMSDKPRLIDGIVLTKFDTIDDKVFAFFFTNTFLAGSYV